MPEHPHLGPYDVVPFRPERNATIDTLRWAKKRHEIVTLLEVDVTAARKAIRSHRASTGQALSFTAWVVSCVAKAAAEHAGVHAIRRGKRQLLQFHEVDVAVVIERAIGGSPSDATLPLPYVVRKANEKTFLEIHSELRGAQTNTVQAGTAALNAGPRPWLQGLFFRSPAWLRDLILWRWLLRSPARIKKTMGTVAVTATGMAAPGVLAWGIPLSIHPLAIGVGGIAQRAVPGRTLEVLALTVVFDHAVTDGAPVGRFVHRLHELMTQASELAELGTSDAAVEPNNVAGQPAPGYGV
jgi:pyruvate/2-oxoglutarate dehydrogenase complex dihydrolipoamide acyltransferase (E2) component